METHRLDVALAARGEEVKRLKRSDLLWLRAQGNGIFGATQQTYEMLLFQRKKVLQSLQKQGVVPRQCAPNAKGPSQKVRLSHIAWLLMEEESKDRLQTLLLRGGGEGIAEWGWLAEERRHPLFPADQPRPPMTPELLRVMRPHVEAAFGRLPEEQKLAANHYMLGYYEGALWAAGVHSLEDLIGISGGGGAAH